MIVCLRAEIWTRDLPNTMEECYPLNHNVFNSLFKIKIMFLRNILVFLFLRLMIYLEYHSVNARHIISHSPVPRHGDDVI
jgi:hypothetical protein